MHKPCITQEGLGGGLYTTCFFGELLQEDMNRHPLLFNTYSAATKSRNLHWAQSVQ